MQRLGSLLRWSTRDLRSRWLQVAGIALVIGIGTGFYSGLLSTSAWRRASYAASYRVTQMYDLRVQLASGSYAAASTLRSVVGSIPHSRDVSAVSVRLDGPIQIDASSPSRTLLVPGAVVGIDLGHGTPDVDTLAVLEGRNLRPSDRGKAVVVLDRHFAGYYKLPANGHIVTSGGRHLTYVGQGLTPDSFVVLGAQQTQETAADYALMFTSLETAQGLLGHPGQANDLMLRVRTSGAEPRVAAELRRAINARLPGVAFTMNDQQQDPARMSLLNTVESTRRLYTIFAVLLLIGAAFGAFNLMVRIVEAQRREIGIAMALGTPPLRIALRPLLVGLEVAVGGVLFGVGVGLFVDRIVGNVLRSYLPLPVWKTGFQAGTFAQGAILGVTVSLVAIAWPVTRAVRVPPVDAIRNTAIAPRPQRRRRVRLPLFGNSIVRMPFRNVLRSRRRAVLTALGIAVTMAVLVALLGLVDAIYATIGTARAEINAGGANTATVTLDDFNLSSAPDVRAIAKSASVGTAETDLQIGGYLHRGRTSFGVLINLLNFDHGVWTPHVSKGSLDATHPGIIIAAIAAHDLHVKVGDNVTLQHPLRTGLRSYRLIDTNFPVLAITNLPARFTVFIDHRWATIFRLQGITNVVTVTPAPGRTVAQLQRSLFEMPGVASVEAPIASVDAVSKQLDELLGVLRVIDAALVVLAGLIAFNASSINFDERAREQATMFAFGLPLASVMTIAIVESLITGLLGTIAGIGLGRIVLSWIVTRMLPSIIPDIGIVNVMHWTTALAAIGLGAVAVTIAPLLDYRHLANMDIPSTLRVME
jgi:putative ABC transport system permease protein